MAKNRFKNPANSDTYTWHINQSYDGETDTGLESNYSWNSSTGGSPLPQFGGKKARIKTLSGTILHKAQHTAFETWAALSESHTIYFRDVDSIEYEVVILSYKPRRQGVVKNPHDPANMPLYIYRYELQMLILGVVA